jgi:endoglucanase
VSAPPPPPLASSASVHVPVYSTASTVTGPLRTSGNEILDAYGTPILLQGVVLNGLEGSAAGSTVTENAIQQIHNWGANFIRVALGEQFWVGSNCRYSPSYVSKVDQVVQWITSRRMVALLDLHFNTVGGCETGAQHNMADAAQSITFWQQVAARYKDDPLVAFDLYNEPHSISDATWLYGGPTTDYYTGINYQAAGMQQMYDAVRSTGAQNLVFVSGTNWANDVPSTLVNGYNIVYAVHDYTCPTAPPPTCTNPNPFDPSPFLGPWLALSVHYPVVLTEFGWPSNSDGTYNANMISFAKLHGWGWSAYCWQQDSAVQPWDLGQWTSQGTVVPTASGQPVQAAMRQ